MRAREVETGTAIGIVGILLASSCGHSPAVVTAGGASSSRVASPALGCPSEMALVADAPTLAPYCIDRWEASLVERVGDVERPFPFYAVPKGKRVRAVSRASVVPQGYISFLDAGAACREAGKRLCREVEWVRACKGPAATKFPYGDARRAGACNDAGTNAMLRMPPEQRAMNMTNMNNPALLQMPSTVAPTGAFAECTNAYGVFDMVGNLHEWIADGAPPKSAWNANTPAAFCGGFFLDTSINGDGCEYKTDAHADWYHDYSTGFRCCADAHAR